jgi:hypothetical protein
MLAATVNLSRLNAGKVDKTTAKELNGVTTHIHQ